MPMRWAAKSGRVTWYKGGIVRANSARVSLVKRCNSAENRERAGVPYFNVCYMLLPAPLSLRALRAEARAPHEA